MYHVLHAIVFFQNIKMKRSIFPTNIFENKNLFHFLNLHKIFDLISKVKLFELKLYLELIINIKMPNFFISNYLKFHEVSELASYRCQGRNSKSQKLVLVVSVIDHGWLSWLSSSDQIVLALFVHQLLFFQVSGAQLVLKLNDTKLQFHLVILQSLNARLGRQLERLQPFVHKHFFILDLLETLLALGNFVPQVNFQLAKLPVQTLVLFDFLLQFLGEQLGRRLGRLDRARGRPPVQLLLQGEDARRQLLVPERQRLDLQLELADGLVLFGRQLGLFDIGLFENC
ncbi:hypothetical protein BpHYR1_013391 [Brachionus plicatilis]|uniref:Uncharacterized protein n=1 Tax=Brachionus plicatilis TaxID=10195 RepID=A0A3M7PMM1_BRAPC|nr:hypothetical protein BpHYR1_013391 [Brachionus plicatilis]